MLPPTEDAFKQHVCTPMLSIWCQGEKVKPEIPEPVGHEWTKTAEGLIKFIMFKQECAAVTRTAVYPESVLLTGRAVMH